jgi:hypothetical protein
VVQNASGFRRVTSHVNYRAEGKWDIGPAFAWEGVIRGSGGCVAALTVVAAPPA